MDDGIADYVKQQSANLSNQKVDSFNVFFKDRFDKEIDIRKVLSYINSLLPLSFLEDIDMIYVGDFKYFEERNINALYLDGAIYVSNEQDNEEDLLDDIVHEIAHLVEERHTEHLYLDREIEKSFLHKRNILERTLRHYNYDTSNYDFNNLEYNKELDTFFYKEVGYEKLNTFIQGLFVSEYSVTSLKEYFATGFEEYYLGDRVLLKQISSYIYEKVASLEQKLEKEENEVYI